MRIGIDARKMGDGGIGRYLENLLTQLLRINNEHHYVLFVTPDETALCNSDRVTCVVEPAQKYSLTEHFSLARKAEAQKLDIFHAPHYTLPLTLKIPAVVTIHDIIHLQDPHTGIAAKAYARFMIGAAAKKAKRIITVSHTSKKELLNLLHLPAKKIVVTHNGGGDFGPMAKSDREKKLNPLAISPGYLLFVGSDRPHKNVTALIEVLKRLPDDQRAVVVGRMRQKSSFAPFGKRVTFVNQVEKETMQALYCGAAALLFPSWLEGFGLPPLEAMACGTPVVASNRSSIPEVCGDAALLCDPDDYDSMVAALQKIASDHHFHDDLVTKGFARAKEFSWEQTAEETLAVYEALAP